MRVVRDCSTVAWRVAFRKLAICYDRHGATVLVFLHLACALIHRIGWWLLRFLPGWASW